MARTSLSGSLPSAGSTRASAASARATSAPSIEWDMLSPLLIKGATEACNASVRRGSGKHGEVCRSLDIACRTLDIACRSLDIECSRDILGKRASAAGIVGVEQQLHPQLGLFQRGLTVAEQCNAALE